MVEMTSGANSKGTAQVLLNGAQEILGMETIQKIFERISPDIQDYDNGVLRRLPLGEAGPFLHALEEVYGSPGGRGLALRIGRSTFQYGLKALGELASLRTMEFRLLPTPRRLESGLHILAQFIGVQFGSQVAVLDEGDHWTWRVRCEPGEDRPSEGSRPAAAQDCYLIAGILQGFTSWASGGRFYRVVETECRASGCLDCIYQIDKKPLD
jgi:hypothetical protein